MQPISMQQEQWTPKSVNISWDWLGAYVIVPRAMLSIPDHINNPINFNILEHFDSSIMFQIWNAFI